MGKAEVNQEVVLMRPIVRKARVRIIQNLIRKINILKVKRGDEKKLIKFKRRADRFLDEVEAAKKIKDDEVSNFGLVNTKSLYSILNDPTSDAHTRVIAKFVDFPELKQRMVQFKEKFPDFEQFLGPGKKKLARLQYEQRAEFIEKKRQKQMKEQEEKKKLNKGKTNSSEDVSDSEMESDNEGMVKEEVEVGEEEEEESEGEEEEEESEGEGEEKDEDEQGANSQEMTEDSESESFKSNTNSKNTPKLKLKFEAEDTSESKTVEQLKKQVLKPSKKEKSMSKRKAEKRKLIESESKTKKEESVTNKSNKTVSKPLKNLNSKIMTNKIAPIMAEPPEKRKLNIEEIKTVSKEVALKRVFDSLEEEDELEEEIEQKVSEDIEPTSETQEKVLKELDSFFVLAETGDKFYSVTKKKVENKNLPDDNLDQANPKEGRNFIRDRSDKNNSSFRNVNKFEERPNKFRRDNTWDKKNSGSKFGPRMEKRIHKKNNPRDRNNGSEVAPRMEKGRGIEARSTDKFSNKFQKTVTSDTHLHPSWAAKKKQQDALKLGFQGKKIVFDD